MKLSNNTTNILKNFSQINQSILIKQGNKLKTISVMKNILAEAEIEEDFEADFAIYDLNQFLSGLSLYDSPDLEFGDSYLTIRDGRRRAKYFFADPSVIVSPPEKEISLPSKDVCFTVATQQLDKLLKAAAIYQVPDLSAIGRNGKVELVVRDKKNDTSHEFSEEVGETSDEFCFNFKVENIKIIPGTYDVVISSKLLSEFTNKNTDLKYYIALEPDSTYV
ncbi:sliding clamp DNA polymerase accessory protein [Synechococcus phage S-CAM9]|uniref:Sliding clamp n=1 Tax=Synechococcus phage S-CAM9 TaxID=1883369 RepID=A0A1D8KNX7_9CAUD|nr:DNA polymerase processivity factor [Synechococcus phage S-CAM9]AOV60277.1 sliding clamp DNA polymerase accessory protein [Synechococcus phage S-CAM9]AOV60505.1 sliding clamp DNA polymerase accessory protein [Synechococcus phage S-CAM9]AOV60734.1 sliding clamp DNA polymerase accessory protein [Synechococcus phage S-CAM9]